MKYPSFWGVLLTRSVLWREVVPRGHLPAICENRARPPISQADLVRTKQCAGVRHEFRSIQASPNISLHPIEYNVLIDSPWTLRPLPTLVSNRRECSTPEIQWLHELLWHRPPNPDVTASPESPPPGRIDKGTTDENSTKVGDSRFPAICNTEVAPHCDVISALASR